MISLRIASPLKRQFSNFENPLICPALGDITLRTVQSVRAFFLWGLDA